MEPTVRGEPWGVRRAANGADLVHAEVVGELNSTGTRDLKLLKCRQVNQADVVTHVEVLADRDRTPPAIIPFDFAFRDVVALGEIGVAAVPLRSFPRTGLEEEGVKHFLAFEQRRHLQVAAVLPLLGGMHNAVGLVEVFFGAAPDVLVVALVVVEAGDVGAVGVDHSRVAIGHPLGDDLGHARAFLDPDGGCRPEVADFGGLA